VSVVETLTTLVVTDTSRFNLGGPLRQLDMFGGRLGVIAGAGGLLFGLGAGAVNAAGRMEQLRIGFTTLLGSADAADRKLREMQDFAKRTPFSLGDIAQGSQQLLGAGLGAERLIPVQEALGNIISANGRSSEDFGAALLQISQIIGNGKLEGDELKILTERGVAVRAEMKALGVTSGSSAEQFLAALVKIGNSAKYAGSMEKQSRTLQGSLSNLADAGFRLGAALGGPLIGPLTALTMGITGLVDRFTALPGPIQALIVGGLGVLAFKVAAVTFQTLRLIPALMGEAAAHYAAANAARVHAAANAQVAGSGGVGGLVGNGGAGFGGLGGFGRGAAGVAGGAARAGGGLGRALLGIGSRLGGPLAILGAAAGVAHFAGNFGEERQGKQGVGFMDTLAHIPAALGFGGPPEEIGPTTDQGKIIAELQKTNELLREQLTAQKDNRSLMSGRVVDTKTLSVFHQRILAGYADALKHQT
jgi:tape measure domain-containing protein